MIIKTRSGKGIFDNVKGRALHPMPGFLAHSFDVNSDKKSKRSTLHIASANGNLLAMQSMLSRGTDINGVNHLQETPLHFATIFCQIDSLEFLLKQPDIDVNVRNYFGETPLHLAVSAMKGDNEYMRFVQILLNSGMADVNVKNSVGDTPAHIAVKNGNFEALAILLEDGRIDVTIKNVSGYTPIELARVYLNNRRSYKMKTILEGIIKMLVRKQTKNAQEYLEMLRLYI